MRNLEEFNGRFKDQVCFVIGSGPSIHFQNLEPLREYATIAVNSGLVAWPGSDFFLSDDWSVQRWSYFYKDLRESNTTILVYADKLEKVSKLLFGRKRVVLFKHRTGYNITDKYEHDNPDNYICQSRTSLGSAIHAAHIMGFSKIILLGVDCRRMHGYRYFWQFPAGHKKGFKKPYRNDGIPDDKYRKMSRKSVETDADLAEILEYWEDQTYDMKFKCDIHNASPITALKVFPSLNLKDFFKNNKEGKKNV